MKTRNNDSSTKVLFKSSFLLFILFLIGFTSLFNLGIQRQYLHKQNSSTVVAKAINYKHTKLDDTSSTNGIQNHSHFLEIEVDKKAIKYNFPPRIFHFLLSESIIIDNSIDFTPYLNRFQERIYIQFCTLKIPF